MTSRFDFIAYDAKAIDEQNKLRGKFQYIEECVAKRWKGEVEKIQIPTNEYREEAAVAKAAVLKFIDLNKVSEAQTQLEILYYLLGKQIRLECIARL